MRLNTDLTQPVFVHASQLDWVPSPAVGVDRRMLYREGAEVARATSIVRYAPGSAFPEHVHSGGEEILVLDGTFQDEHGDYPAGSYFRNPPGTAHSPAAADGCIIFVRLWQYRSVDDVQINRQPDEGTAQSPRPGAKAARLLFEADSERVWIEDWTPGANVVIENAKGLEFLLTAGEALINGEVCTTQSWGRLPAGQTLSASVGPKGAQIWIKSAPLQHADVLKMPG
jgi:quercetin dioxygenase-like cupin family protein